MSDAAGRCVLIVDDDLDLREALRFVLETKGFTVVAAADGAVALQALRGGLRPSLILLDLMMPTKDGVEFRTEQRKDPALADIPIVVMSARYDAEQYASQMGAAAYLKKPMLSLDGLLSVVWQHCKPQT